MRIVVLLALLVACGSPPAPEVEGRYLWDLISANHYPVNLPVASMCGTDEDNDPDDRLVFVLTADGRIFFKERGLTLAEFADVLRAQRLDYELKLRRIGKRVEHTEGWSRLYVLLLVDRDAPCQHVLWMLAELEAERVFKLQFGARRLPYTPPGAGDTARARAGRGKLQVFLPAGGMDPDEVDRISAASGTRFGEVAHDINQFHAAGQERLELVGITRAPEAIRKLARLQPVRD